MRFKELSYESGGKVMYGIYCNAIGLEGFVTGSYQYRGAVYVSTFDLNTGKTIYARYGKISVNSIKVYKSKKRAENAIKDYENAFSEDFEVKKFTDEEVQLIMLKKEGMSLSNKFKESLFKNKEIIVVDPKSELP